ncbi:MAG: alcohol dehydrogenase catalytic domain-containing protein [Lachnospiraceae bacterium]|jgi:threonine dehydrogenase-like Zn-dependent dehydrogenase|nr:alcohol dehydrogenase catalytic domain-containing protein [Lachnospiraceae bacterium]
MNNYPSAMKALVAHGKNDYSLETNFPTPECGDDDIILKVEGCGICAGDLKCQHGADMFWGGNGQPSWVEPPFIPGHEFIGIAVQVGKSVNGVSEGDRLTAEQIYPCGECRFCKDGHYWMCQPHLTFGFFHTVNGGMAEYIRLPKNSRVHHVPQDLPLDKALLIEPYACAKHCVDRADIKGEDVVVLSGAGTLGLGMVSYARTRNPKTLIVLDLADNRLEKAKEFGADLVWNPSRMDVVSEIMKLTDGYGCDTYIEATGHPASVNQGMSMIRKLGRFVEFSVFGAPTTLDWSIIGDRKELDVLGSHLSPYCFPYVIENIANGTLNTNGVVSKMFSIEDWKEAFDCASGKNGDLKVVFKF